jgi:hypothetical protein
LRLGREHFDQMVAVVVDAQGGLVDFDGDELAA